MNAQDFDRITYEFHELNDLLLVGMCKAMGYLPIPTLRKYTTEQELGQYLESKGLRTRLYRPGECTCSNNGSLYAYDSEMLQEILDKNSSILYGFGWPVNADNFVDSVAKVVVPSYTPLFDLIADCFSDHGNPGRTSMREIMCAPHRGC